GSIFINQEHTYVFDPEFAFYGPMGYDIGNVIANMFFAWCNGNATIEDQAEKENFCGWVLDAIVEIVDKFIVKFKISFQENVTDTMAKTEGFMEWYLGNVLKDTAAVAGFESIRRTVGMANVKDITSITDVDKRERAEKTIILLAKNYIMNRETFVSGADYRRAIEEAIAKF
ncbi:MAG: S-methyl-5-thioribose kinase, partial [Lachnospiraceae bacterium]|nr:S-methyl-5-thioribose kinase [Lachnospiraceae bacterium]